MIRILLCDDQALLRAGMRRLVEEQSDFAVVGEVGDADDGMREVRRLSPDITLANLDTMRCGSSELPAYFGADGGGGGQVVVLARDDDGNALMHAVRAGAKGVILMTSSPDELASGIRAVAAGGVWMTPAIAHRVVAQVSGVATSDTSDVRNLSRLTSRELDVLNLLGGGLSNAEIAGALVVGEATVKSHVSSVLRKLNVRNRVQAMLLARHVSPARHDPVASMIRPGRLRERSG